VALARKEAKPDLALQAGYMNRGGLDPMWQAGVSITLPLSAKRREAPVAEAAARQRAAERQAESVQLQLRFRTEERLAQLRAAEALVALYEKGIVPQDQMSVEAAIASYQAGKVPFLAVLESLSTLYSDRTTQLQLVAAHVKARASLEEASLEATTDAMPAGAPGRGFGGMSGGSAAVGAGAAAMGSMGR
jgi:outer membrane protein TolC